MRGWTSPHTDIACSWAAIAVVLVLPFVKPVVAFQVDLGPESIVLEGKYDKPASFPHRRHQGWYGCTACHHAREQIMTVDKCESCHNGNIGNSQFDSLRKAAHELCKNCHKAEREKGRVSAPTQCRGCHTATD